MVQSFREDSFSEANPALTSENPKLSAEDLVNGFREQAVPLAARPGGEDGRGPRRTARPAHCGFRAYLGRTPIWPWFACWRCQRSSGAFPAGPQRCPGDLARQRGSGEAAGPMASAALCHPVPLPGRWLSRLSASCPASGCLHAPGVTFSRSRWLQLTLPGLVRCHPVRLPAIALPPVRRGERLAAVCAVRGAALGLLADALQLTHHDVLQPGPLGVIRYLLQHRQAHVPACLRGANDPWCPCPPTALRPRVRR